MCFVLLELDHRPFVARSIVDICKTGDIGAFAPEFNGGTSSVVGAQLCSPEDRVPVVVARREGCGHGGKGGCIGVSTKELVLILQEQICRLVVIGATPTRKKCLVLDITCRHMNEHQTSSTLT